MKFIYKASDGSDLVEEITEQEAMKRLSETYSDPEFHLDQLKSGSAETSSVEGGFITALPSHSG